MWTGDARVFFYNPSSRTSVWERPDDLIGRADVDKMVASPPESGGSTTTGGSVNNKRAGSPDSSEAGDATPSKRLKKEGSPLKGLFLSILF